MTEEVVVSNTAVVQQRTTLYSKQEPRDVIIAFRMARTMAERIDNYRSLHRKKSRTDAIMDLLATGLCNG